MKKYIEGLYEAFVEYHRKEMQEFYMTQTTKAKIKVSQDVDKGGAIAFRDVKDMPTPPLDAHKLGSQK